MIRLVALAIFVFGMWARLVVILLPFAAIVGVSMVLAWWMSLHYPAWAVFVGVLGWMFFSVTTWVFVQMWRKI